MMVRINLLPGDYRASRKRARRLRLGLICASVLLGAEIATALVLHLRAHDTRRMLDAAQAAREMTRTVRQELERPTQQAEMLGRQIALAERLRSKHHWSRLLGALSQAMPDNVVLTTLSTDPAQWTSALKPVLASASGQVQGQGRKLVEGVILNGRAADHADLAALVAALHASGVFESVDLRQARREKYLEHEAIVFELNCRW